MHTSRIPKIEIRRDRGFRSGLAVFVVSLSSALFAMGAMAGGWIELGIGFLIYKDAGPTDVLNLANYEDEVLAAASEQGLQRIQRRTGAMVVLAPPEGLQSIDDVFVADDLVFVLDARAPGAVAVLDPAKDWGLTGPAQPVEVGPFSGVSAAKGVMAVSGGTKPMAWFGYDSQGIISDVRSRPDFGRGQPDILLTPDGENAVISAHISGPDFGVIWAEIREGGASIADLSYIALSDAGFTRGGHRPANFPIQSALINDRLLVAHGGGLAIIALSNEGAVLEKVIDVGYPLTAITVFGDQVLVAGDAGKHFQLTRLSLGEAGLSVEAHRELNDVPGRVGDLWVDGDVVWLAAGSSGVTKTFLP